MNRDAHLEALSDLLIDVLVREIAEEMNLQKKMPRPYELAGSAGAEDDEDDLNTTTSQ